VLSLSFACERLQPGAGGARNESSVVAAAARQLAFRDIPDVGESPRFPRGKSASVSTHLKDGSCWKYIPVTVSGNDTPP
jgi:hypothetical protein